MKISSLVTVCVCTAVLCGCVPSKKSFDQQVLADFEETVALLESANQQLFPASARLADTLRTCLTQSPFTPEETQALQFLYAYMPLNDIMEHPFDYYLQAVRHAFRTRELPWGKQIPEEVFRQYVLPPRVNNEYLDNARDLFYSELYPRVKDLSMNNAVIEINHWCREKILYQPTDARTTPPVHTSRRGYGRCGEESVVTVAALRSVGIPARQVYVPRWAHTDDNHAWVEVWVDGEWFYLGACEPEPALDRGWFTGPSSRALLVNTWAFGPQDLETKSHKVKNNTSGYTEEVLSTNRCYTEVSTIANYAPVKQANVQVLTTQGIPVEGASVRFGIYNFGTFYHLAVRSSDAQGMASLTTGLGTLLIEVSAPMEGIAASVARATAADRMYYKAMLYRVAETDTLNVILDGDDRSALADDVSRVDDYMMIVPVQTAFQTDLLPEQAALHAARCAYDDSVRVAHQMPDPYRTNVESIEFILEKYGKLGEQLIEQLRPKDRQEVPASILEDYLQGVQRLGNVYVDTPLYRDNVLNPRISNEAPLAYKAALWEVLVNNGMETPGENPQTLSAVRKVLDALVWAPQRNPRGFDISALAPALFGLTDASSWDICGVALYRTAGIPARIDPVSGRFQAYLNGEWQVVVPKEETGAQTSQSARPTLPSKGVLTISCNVSPLPAYDTQFTLARWENSESSYRTLGFSAESGGVDGVAVLNVPHTLEAGYYRLISGVRMADGSVMARVRSFVLPEDGNVTVPLDFTPSTSNQWQEIGALDVSFVHQAVGARLCVVALLDATQEPSQHFIREFAGLNNPLPVPVVFAFPSAESLALFHSQNYGLPKEGTQGSPVYLSDIPASFADFEKPAVFLVDENNKVYYQSVGYSLGIPLQLSLLPYPKQ